MHGCLRVGTDPGWEASQERSEEPGRSLSLTHGAFKEGGDMMRVSLLQRRDQLRPKLKPSLELIPGWPRVYAVYGRQG